MSGQGEVAVLGLRIDGTESVTTVQKFGNASATAAKQGEQLEKTVNRVEQAMKRANSTMQSGALAQQRAREQAKAYADGLEQQYRVEMARIREGQVRGFITPAQARAAGREAAVAYNQGIASAIDRAARTPGVFNGKDGRESYISLAGSMKNVDIEGRKA